VLSDCTDKHALAAVVLEEFILDYLREQDWFRPAWDAADRIKRWYDAGRHFYNEEFLGYALLTWVQKHGKEACVQYFCGGDGKTEVDGQFGDLGKAIAELVKQMRLTTTDQLRDFAEKRKIRHQQRLTAEERELTRHVYLVWKPGRFPTKAVRFKQESLQSNYCWEGIPRPRTDRMVLHPVDVFCHGLAEDKEHRLRMEPGIGYTRQVVRPRAGGRDNWTYAASVVAETAEAKLEPIISTMRTHAAQRRESSSFLEPAHTHLHLGAKSGTSAGQKRKR
jgi:hypothetical protein